MTKENKPDGLGLPIGGLEEMRNILTKALGIPVDELADRMKMLYPEEKPIDSKELTSEKPGLDEESARNQRKILEDAFMQSTFLCRPPSKISENIRFYMPYLLKKILGMRVTENGDARNK